MNRRRSSHRCLAFHYLQSWVWGRWPSSVLSRMCTSPMRPTGRTRRATICSSLVRGRWASLSTSSPAGIERRRVSTWDCSRRRFHRTDSCEPVPASDSAPSDLWVAVRRVGEAGSVPPYRRGWLAFEDDALGVGSATCIRGTDVADGIRWVSLGKFLLRREICYEQPGEPWGAQAP